MTDYIGNRRIYDFFSQIDKQRELGHAYGFAGLEQVGKRTLARIAAGQLLKVSPDKLTSHPDFYFVERGIDEKTGKLKKDISVEQSRGIKDILLRRSWLGGYQVVTIDGVEHLNASSANSLLKFLEEPSGNTIIFIITADEKQLLPTVRSRCQWWRFNTVGEEEIRAALIKSGVEAALAQETAGLSWGRPGRAMALCENSEKLAHTKEEIGRYEKLRAAPVYERFKIIESLAGEKKSAARGKDELDEILQIWTAVEAKNILSGPLAKQRESGQIVDKLTQLRIYLDQNIHPRLALEEFCLSFPAQGGSAWGG